MEKVVSITSQGQVTIPAKIRRFLGFKKTDKVVMKVEEDRVVVEPLRDLMEMGGSLKDRAMKGLSIDEIIQKEEEAAAEMMGKQIDKK